MSKVSIEIEKACKLIAASAAEQLRVIASAAEAAKVLLATESAKAVKIEEKRNSNNGVMDFIYKQGTLVVAIVGVCFGIFFTFNNPTQDNSTALQLQDQRISSQRLTIDELTKNAQNDTQEVKAAIKDLITDINEQKTEIATLTAIINERILAKK